jgi:hypothetical protein
MCSYDTDEGWKTSQQMLHADQRLIEEGKPVRASHAHGDRGHGDFIYLDIYVLIILLHNLSTYPC